MNDDVVILIVEDDDGHAELVEETLRDAGIANPIRRFRDGQEAWEFLSGIPTHAAGARAAYLVLLDIRMPRMDGVELLGRIKADAGLRPIPVIMLTTTDDQREVQECYRLGCNSYITKPVEFGSFVDTLHHLGHFVLVLRVAQIG